MNEIRRFMVCGAVALCACGATAAGLTEENFRTARADGRFERSLGWVMDAMRRQKPKYSFDAISNRADQAVWRGRVRTKLKELLELSDRRADDPKLVGEEKRSGYVLRRYEFYPEDNLVVPALVLVPDEALRPGAKVPAVVCLPGSFASLESLAGEPDRHFTRYPLRNRQGWWYAKAGMIAVCLENPCNANCSEQGVIGDSANSVFYEYMERLGRSTWGFAAERMLDAVAFLRRQENVDASKIALSGMSLGCFGTLYAGVVSDDVSAIVFNDFVCSWMARMTSCTRRQPWNMYWTGRDVRGMNRWFDDEPDLLAALEPKALHLVEGGAWKDCIDKIVRSYDLAGASDRLRVDWYEKYADPAARKFDGRSLRDARGLTFDEHLVRSNVDASQHSFHADKVLPWLQGLWGLKPFSSELRAALAIAVAERERKAGRPEPRTVLTMDTPKGNPRNGEGDFIRLKDGRVLFVYTEWSGELQLDEAPAHLVRRYSSDGGETWTKPEEFVPRLGRQNDMSVSLLRMDDGRIALFYARKNGETDCMPVVRYSSDEGATWSGAEECIAAARRGYYVLNNARVEKLGSGRIILPVCRHGFEKGKFDGRGHLSFVWSDDAGRTWKHGPEFRPTDEKGGVVLVQEPGLVELKDGRLYLYARTDRGCQWQGFSKDGGETWGDLGPSPIRGPISPATIRRLKGGELLCLWNDHGRHPLCAKTGGWGRAPLAVALSADEGRTWTSRGLLESDPCGFSCYYSVLELEDSLLVSYYNVPCLKGSCVKKVPLSWLR